MTSPQCQEPGCPRPAKARGLCNAHYKARRKSDPSFVIQRRGTPEERFWAKVDKRGPDECWPWTAFIEDDGYGMFGITGSHSVRAHRFAYEAEGGQIPKGFELDHLCHTRDTGCTAGKECPHRRCVNPAHLEPVPGLVNIFRGRGFATAETCIRGHPLSGENLYVQPGNGERICRACKLRRKREQNARTRTANRAAGRVANADKTHCKRGHPLSGDNLYVSPRGVRQCRQCNRDRAKGSYRRNQADAA